MTAARTALLRGKTFEVTRAPSETEELYILRRGRVEFLARVNADGSVTAFNYNTMGPTVVGGKTVRLGFESGRFISI